MKREEADSLVIPSGATEEVDTHWENGAKQSAYYKVAGKPVGFRWWNDDGLLVMEYGLKGVHRHGTYRAWHDNGVLSEESFFIEGKEHGTARQYDTEGSLIGTYEMDHGTGVDLWYDRPGVLSEERYYEGGQRHGFERWWSHDNKSVWEESHFQAGIEHGIARQWNIKGHLSRGYPQYSVNGVRVNKRQYLRASERDPTLPRFRDEDNRPQRELPPELTSAK